jgi:hypothetical protein
MRLKRNTVWVTALAVITMLAAGCGPGTSHVGQINSPASTATAGPTPSLQPSPTPRRSPGECDARFSCLALVTLRGSNQIVVRDVTDINHPRTVATLGTPFQPKFVNSSEVSFIDQGLVRMALSGSAKTTVTAQPVSDFDWSPDGTTAVYVVYAPVAGGGTTGTLHIVTAGQDKVLASGLRGPPASWGCESQTCADSVSTHLAISPWDDAISWGQSLNPAFQMWGLDGTSLLWPDAESNIPSMIVWSDAAIYYRDTFGVERYQDKQPSTFLPGVSWIRPKASPDGKHIVYEVRDLNGTARVFIVDTTSARVKQLGPAGRAEPAFLTARYVWYRGERPCTTSDLCASGPMIATGKTYLYDLQTGIEYDSVITSVIDVWPHAA